MNWKCKNFKSIWIKYVLIESYFKQLLHDMIDFLLQLRSEQSTDPLIACQTRVEHIPHSQKYDIKSRHV